MFEQAFNEEDVAESDLVTRRGTFRAVAFRADGHEHMALVYGKTKLRENVLVRIHSECMTGDIFAAMRCECGEQLDAALNTIVREGNGILVYLRGHEGRGIGLVSKIRTHVLQDAGLDTLDSATSGCPCSTALMVPFSVITVTGPASECSPSKARPARSASIGTSCAPHAGKAMVSGRAEGW